MHVFDSKDVLKLYDSLSSNLESTENPSKGNISDEEIIKWIFNAFDLEQDDLVLKQIINDTYCGYYRAIEFIAKQMTKKIKKSIPFYCAIAAGSLYDPNIAYIILAQNTYNLAIELAYIFSNENHYDKDEKKILILEKENLQWYKFHEYTHYITDLYFKSKLDKKLSEGHAESIAYEGLKQMGLDTTMLLKKRLLSAYIYYATKEGTPANSINQELSRRINPEEIRIYTEYTKSDSLDTYFTGFTKIQLLLEQSNQNTYSSLLKYPHQQDIMHISEVL